MEKAHDVLKKIAIGSAIVAIICVMFIIGLICYGSYTMNQYLLELSLQIIRPIVALIIMSALCIIIDTILEVKERDEERNKNIWN